MEVFTVSLFGHRRIDDIRTIYDRLVPVIENLILTKSYIEFFIGRNGEFDECAASIIKQVQKGSNRGNSDINLILPYLVADIEYYEKYYDNVIIPECLYGIHPKLAITMKNRWMVEQSDLVIVYVQQKNGGAYRVMKYAEKLNKEVINID